MDSQVPFRAIIIGAGISGLVTSHILQSANISHIVLERRVDIAPPEGASIAIYPHGARILFQLGLYERVKAASVPCKWFFSRRPDGKAISRNGLFKYVRENHGHDIFLLERRELLQILYDGLPDKSLVRRGCQIGDIEEHTSGVNVKLSDGTVESGDIVIGADGAYSWTRNLMWQHANSRTGRPMTITAKEKTSMVTSWKCLIGMAHGCPELGQCDMTVVHNNRFSFLALTQPTKTFFFVFFRLDKPFTWPKRERFTEQEAEELAASVADHPVSETLLFGELWKRRIRGQLISIEEGILEHWHDGRIVLIGDAVHKVTPNIALGGNSSMESAVVLCNHLHRMLDQHAGAKPSRDSIRKAFDMYQKERIPRMKEILEFSSLITRVQAWETPMLKFIANWVLPYQADRGIADQLGEIIRRAPKLNWVDTNDFGKGRLAWQDEEKQPAKMELKEKGDGQRRHLEAVFKGVFRVSGALMFLIVVYSALV
ncbi:FAD binding domain protein [Polyplosphaeria fusca]|uniref:FAD binding domain protein n=1 Tax=Polyplosphaeria fusca TaxID=682080 RepID=A0A9P4QJ22_9PLEO|nr:FAD binding domain protein [Polyplosphaeria fusca]